jgi:hypothetical protein
MFGEPIEAAPGQRRPGDDDDRPAVQVHHPIVLLILPRSRPQPRAGTSTIHLKGGEAEPLLMAALGG